MGADSIFRRYTLEHEIQREQPTPAAQPQNTVVSPQNKVVLLPNYLPYNMANDLAALKENISFLYVLRAQMCSEPLNSSKTSTKRLLPLFYML
jgi:hypothetical protein